MAFQIVTDTCCDFPQQYYTDLSLNVVPLAVTYKGETINTYTEQWLQDMYNGLRQGESASTCAVNPTQWSEAMESVLKNGDDVLVLAFSSGLSTTYQSAVIAANELQEQYPDRTIKVCDTLCASMGQGLLAWYACQKRDAGMSLTEVYTWVEDHKQNLCHWFTVDDLMYLKRGGRVSAATALVGTMLQIKPVLHVDHEGHLINVSKVRGRKAALDALVKKMKDTMLPGENDTVFISHGDCLEEAQYVAQKVKEICGAKEVIISYVGAVIGSHAGPGTMALFYLGTHR